MKRGLTYSNINLPQTVSKILEEELWVLENIGPEMIKSVTEPVKFSANTWIFVKSGGCRAEINLVNYNVEAPAFVTIKNKQIMMPYDISEDFNASVLVMSKNFADNLFIFLKDSPMSSISFRHAVVKIPDEVLPAVSEYTRSLREIMSATDNPYSNRALLYRTLLFIYEHGYKCYEEFKDELLSNSGHISDQFLSLVQEYFRSERFLEFYANKLGITPKHLSRTVKKQTGFTAVEWIEKYVILEAKVLLKSSNLNIQQIADELNFPSQSFFGKYFKKITGMSPKEFRNT